MAKEVLVNDIGFGISADTNVFVSVSGNNLPPIGRHDVSVEHRHMACNHQHLSGRGQQRTYQEDRLRLGFEKGQPRECTWAVSRRKGR